MLSLLHVIGCLENDGTVSVGLRNHVVKYRVVGKWEIVNRFCRSFQRQKKFIYLFIQLGIPNFAKFPDNKQ